MVRLSDWAVRNVEVFSGAFFFFPLACQVTIVSLALRICSYNYVGLYLGRQVQFRFLGGSNFFRRSSMLILAAQLR